jgi:hypothetical protein
MKKRKGFISNSSSSSFIIAITESKPCKHCGGSNVDILSIFNELGNHGSCESCVDAKGKEETIKHINQTWFSDNTKKDILDKINKIKGKTVAAISVSYHDDFLQDIIKNSKNIEILYTCGD